MARNNFCGSSTEATWDNRLGNLNLGEVGIFGDGVNEI